MTGPDNGLMIRHIGDKTIVDIEVVNIDFRNSEAIKSQVASLLNQGNKQILLNLGKVTFMDSSGLGVILFCQRACDEAKGKFGVFGVQNYVNNLITLTNLHKAIAIFPAESEATAAV